MAKKSFRTAVMVKRELTYGTLDGVLDGSVNSILIRDATITPLEAMMEERTIVKGYFGADEKIIVGQLVKIDFTVEAAGSGTLGLAPAWGVCSRASGLSQTISAGVSVIYAPVSQGWESASFYFNRDGVVHIALGGRSSKKLTFKAGSIPTIQYSVVALYSGPIDAVFPSQVFSSWQKPVAVNNSNTSAFVLHGYSGVLAALSIDISTSPTYKNLVGAERVDLEAATITGKITVELPTVAVKDFISICKAGTLGALTFTHGTVAGNKIKLDSSYVQLSNPTYGDGKGDVHLSMDMTCVQLVSGESPLTITVI